MRFTSWAVALLLVFLFILWIFIPSIVQSVIVPLNSINLKTVPDGYSAFSALFSALAFTLLLMTVYIQNKQLKIQEKELNKADHMHSLNIKMSAYSALLNYYDKAAYDPGVCNLTPKAIAEKLNYIISESEEEST